MITIQVNDKAQFFAEELTVKALIDELQVPKNGIAVAINNTVVSKSNWSHQMIVDQDRILIIKSTQGG